MVLLKCPVCKASDITVFMEGVYDCEETNVMECRGCGLQFLDPMMSDEEEERYYRNYYEAQKPRHYKSMSLKDLQQRALSLYEQYEDIY